MIYDASVEKLLGALVCFSTSPFHYLLDAAVPSIDSSVGGTAARHYEIGTLRELPIPSASLKQHAETGAKLFQLALQRYSFDETTIYFAGLPTSYFTVTLKETSAVAEMERLKAQIDAIDLHSRAERDFTADYGMDEAAIQAINDYMGPHPGNLPNSQLSQLARPQDVWKHSAEELTSLLIGAYGGKRRFSKQTWVGGREIELWANVTNLAPAQLALSLKDNAEFSQRNAPELAARVASYVFGVVFGRWDIRYASGERAAPELPDALAPLPVCPPGMLQGDDGLPLLAEAGRRLRDEGRYPLDVAWDGILVDDPKHPLDLERRVLAALSILWGDRVEALEHEACALLGVQTLREWLNRPTNFFADHLKRYSKSRRQAPIYWPLSTVTGSYTVWLYYHRIERDTLYRCLELVKEKLQHEETVLATLLVELGPGGDPRQRRELAAQEDFVGEVRGFLEEVSRVAPLWAPNLDDGVIINFSPLWRLIPHKPWQKVVKACWDELSAGEYDWARLAMHLWPERVVPKCANDRSLAIAHGLENVFWVAGNDGSWTQRKTPTRSIDELVRERMSLAVKSALKSLTQAPAVIGNGSHGRRGRRKPSRAPADRAEV